MHELGIEPVFEKRKDDEEPTVLKFPGGRVIRIMANMENFIVLAACLCQLMVFLFPVTLLLVVFWVLAIASTPNRTENGHFLRGCLATFITPLGIILFSAAFTNSGFQTLANITVLVSLIFHFALSVYLVTQWPNGTRAIIASAVVSGYMALAAAFIGVQAVAGDWL